jgi:hypothetical protein
VEKQKPRTVNEIVDEIIIKRELIEPSHRQEVLTEIANLKKLAGAAPFWGYKKENRDCANALRKQIEKLQKTLDEMPNHMARMFFGPNEVVPIVVMATNAGENYHALTGALRDLLDRCRLIEMNPPGVQRSTDHLQRRVAKAAKLLMQQSGKRVGSSSPESPFRLLAGLLYEAVTEVVHKDMERACDYIARVPIRTE